MVKTLCFHCKRCGVDAWWEKFCIPQGMSEKRENPQKTIPPKNYTCGKCHQEKALYLLGPRGFVQGESEAV